MASVPFHTREGLHAMRITTAISRSLPHGGTEGDGRRDSRSHNILGAERTASTSAFFNTLDRFRNGEPATSHLIDPAGARWCVWPWACKHTLVALRLVRVILGDANGLREQRVEGVV